MTTPLTDVRTGETFTLADFEGKVVILETMAVWCPLCDQQQGQILGALEQLGEEVVAVSLDVDLGETEDIVARHADQLGLPWRFALAPPEVAEALRRDFGPQVLSPPATPVILIGPDGRPQLTPFGIKDSQALVSAVRALSPQAP